MSEPSKYAIDAAYDIIQQGKAMVPHETFLAFQRERIQQAIDAATAELRAEAETKRKAASILYHYYEEQKALAREMADALAHIIDTGADEPHIADGHVAGEFSYGDLRAALKALAKYETQTNLPQDGQHGTETARPQET